MSGGAPLLKSAAQIEAMARAGAILGQLFEAIAPRMVPGTTTAALDRFGEEFIRSHPGAEPAFKGLYGFPGSLCISINEEVVHGIPTPKRVLAEGDTVTIDGGVRLEGWYADAARTFPVGEIDAETRRLLDVTWQALEAGIAQAWPGRRMGDIGAAIQAVAEGSGFGVVRDLVGHGLGRSPHEEPQVPNYGRPGKGMVLREGLVLAIEPMINAGTAEVRTLEDKWTVVTSDGARSAHFEQTVAITAAGPRILTQADVAVRS